MYIVTNGEGYVFAKPDGTQVLNRDEVPGMLEEIMDAAEDAFRPLIYELTAAENEFGPILAHDVTEG